MRIDSTITTESMTKSLSHCSVAFLNLFWVDMGVEEFGALPAKLLVCLIAGSNLSCQIIIVLAFVVLIVQLFGGTFSNELTLSSPNIDIRVLTVKYPHMWLEERILVLFFRFLKKLVIHDDR